MKTCQLGDWVRFFRLLVLRSNGFYFDKTYFFQVQGQVRILGL